MSQTATKIPRCNRCFHEISWNKTRREELNTTKPVTPDLEFIHECPKDGNGKVIVAAGFEQQAKENYEKYLASKAAGATTGGNTATAGSVASSVAASQQQPQPQPQQQYQEPTPAQQGQAAIAGILNSEKLDTSIKTAFAELLRQNQQFLADQETRFQRMEDQITRMEDQVNNLSKTVEDYVTYNPAARGLEGIFNRLLPLVDMKSFREKTALDALENQKTNTTIEGEFNN